MRTDDQRTNQNSTCILQRAWCDMERVKVLVDLYEHFDCLWYVKYPEYKNVSSDVIISTAVAYGMARETCPPDARVSAARPARAPTFTNAHISQH